MLKLLTLGLLLGTVYGHNNIIQNEADLQTSLIPQELNPEFAAEKEPWKTIMPLSRIRRDVSDKSVGHFALQLQKYSRVVACVVLVASAVVELVLYVLDTYYT